MLFRSNYNEHNKGDRQTHKGKRMTLGTQSVKLGKSYPYGYVVKHSHKEKYEEIIELGDGSFNIGFQEFENQFYKYLNYYQELILKYDDLTTNEKLDFRESFLSLFPNKHESYFYTLRANAFSVPDKISFKKYKVLKKIYNTYSKKKPNENRYII